MKQKQSSIGYQRAVSIPTKYNDEREGEHLHQETKN